MNTESSYEGAVRRLRMMGHDTQPVPKASLGIPSFPSSATQPAFDLAGARLRVRGTEPTIDAASAARLSELEELATLACEENDRLEAAMAELRDENASLKRRISMLEAAIADPRTALGLTGFSGSLSAIGQELEPDELPRRGAWLRAGLSVALIGLSATTLLAIAAGFAAGDSGLTLAARLRSPVIASLDGVAAALDAVVARGSAVHPRFGRDLVPAGWAPVLPEPEPTPPPQAEVKPVLPTAPATEPAQSTPVAKHPAKKAAHKQAPKKLASGKAQKLPKHIKPKGSDPLSGLDL